MTQFWPGTKTPKSTGNAFDLSKREHSIFYDPKRPPPVATKRFGRASTAPTVSTVAPVKGLSKQARAQLAKAPKSITISNSEDAQRRRKNAMAAL